MQEALRRFKSDIFQALAHPTRIAIIELLRDGGMLAGTLAERLGLEPANVSQHLAILRSKKIVECHRDGNQVCYSLRDSTLLEVLDIMRRYFLAHLNEATQMLHQIELEQGGTQTG